MFCSRRQTESGRQAGPVRPHQQKHEISKRGKKAQLIMRPKETFDGAMPSGNSMMAYDLVRLYYLTDSEELYASRQRFAQYKIKTRAKAANLTHSERALGQSFRPLEYSAARFGEPLSISGTILRVKIMISYRAIIRTVL